MQSTKVCTESSRRKKDRQQRWVSKVGLSSATSIDQRYIHYGVRLLSLDRSCPRHWLGSCSDQPLLCSHSPVSCDAAHQTAFNTETMGNIKLPYSRCSLKPSNTQLSACAPPRPWASAKPFPCQTRLPCPQATYKDSRSGKSRRGASRPAPTRPTGRRSPHPTQEDGPDEDIRPNAEHSETRQHRGEDQRGEDLQEEDQGGEEGEQEEVSAVDGFFDGKAYRLVPTENGENTILINGMLPRPGAVR